MTDRRHYYRVTGYGLTPDDYDKIVDYQGNKCWTCGKPPGKYKLSIDHDHKTGLVRGLLCQNCNRTLGMIERRGPETIQRLVEYLLKPPAVIVVGEKFGGIGRVGTKKWRRQAAKRRKEWGL